MEVYMESVIAQAKKNIRRDSDMEPMFLIIDRDERMVTYEAGWDDAAGKRDVVSWLARTVKQLGSVRYFYAGTGWSVHSEKVQSEFELARKILLSNPSADAMKIFLREVFKLVMFSPSENPARREVLMVSEFEKDIGTKTVALEITRSVDAVSFGVPKSLTDDVVKSYSRWNVWSPVQITIQDGGDGDDNKKRE